MRRSILTAIILLAAYCMATAQTVPTTGPTTAPIALRCTIAVPERKTIQIGPGHSPLHVVLQNMSDRPLSLADEWNSWGYFSLTLRCATQDGHQTDITKVGRDWTRNFLTTTTLQPGEMLVRDVAFDPAVWSGLPDAGPITVTATFKQTVASGDDARDKLWAGTAMSSPVLFELRK